MSGVPAHPAHERAEKTLRMYRNPETASDRAAIHARDMLALAAENERLRKERDAHARRLAAADRLAEAAEHVAILEYDPQRTDDQNAEIEQRASEFRAAFFAYGKFSERPRS